MYLGERGVDPGSEYGLAAYVYTSDLAAGLRVSERLAAGMVGLNRPVVSDPSAPFGGVKQSGLGREGGHEGLLSTGPPVRLELKHFVRQVMSQSILKPDGVQGWRGEIRDGQVVSESDQ